MSYVGVGKKLAINNNVQLPRLDVTRIRRPVRINRAKDYLLLSDVFRRAGDDRLARGVITARKLKAAKGGCFLWSAVMGYCAVVHSHIISCSLFYLEIYETRTEPKRCSE